MTTAIQRLNRIYVQNNCAVGVRTLPFGLVKQWLLAVAGTVRIMLPISCFAQGLSVPISREVPPRSG